MTDARPTPEIVELAPVTTAVVAGSVPVADLPTFFDAAFARIPAVLAAQGVEPTGPAFARYAGPPGEVVELEVGFPIGQAVEPDGQVRPGSLPGGRVATVVHHGSFDGLGGAWGTLAAWIAEQGLAGGADLWEVYVTEPPEMDPADLRTALFHTLQG